MKRIRILIIGLPALLSDIVGEAFAREADIEVISIAAPPAEATALARTMRPDVIVTSLNASGASDFADQIRRGGSSIVVVAIAPSGDRATLFADGRPPLEISDISTGALLAAIRNRHAEAEPS